MRSTLLGEELARIYSSLVKHRASVDVCGDCGARKEMTRKVGVGEIWISTAASHSIQRVRAAGMALVSLLERVLDVSCAFEAGFR